MQYIYSQLNWEENYMSVKKSSSTNKKTTKSNKKPDLSKYIDEIKDMAFEIFLERQRMNKSGSELSDWLEAEERVIKKYKL